MRRMTFLMVLLALLLLAGSAWRCLPPTTGWIGSSR